MPGVVAHHDAAGERRRADLGEVGDPGGGDAHVVEARPAVEVVAVLAVGVEAVVAVAAVDRIAAVAAGQPVVPGVAEQRVVAVPADQEVVAGPAGDQLATAAGGDVVVAVAAAQLDLGHREGAARARDGELDQVVRGAAVDHEPVEVVHRGAEVDGAVDAEVRVQRLEARVQGEAQPVDARRCRDRGRAVRDRAGEAVGGVGVGGDGERGAGESAGGGGEDREDERSAGTGHGSSWVVERGARALRALPSPTAWRGVCSSARRPGKPGRVSALDRLKRAVHAVGLHRITTHPCPGLVEVTLDGVPVAASRRAVVLRETGSPERFYLPRDDVRTDRLTRSATVTHCPFKGDAAYFSLPGAEDAFWTYAAPPDAQARPIAGMLAPDPGRVDVRVGPARN